MSKKKVSTGKLPAPSRNASDNAAHRQTTVIDTDLLIKKTEKKKLTLSIISYVMGIAAVLLAVLFVAEFAGYSVWFTPICRLLFAVFSWASLFVPILMIYSAVFLPKIVLRKTHIWNLILASLLCINISLTIGLVVLGTSPDRSMSFVDIWKAGWSHHSGAGIIGSYFAWLLREAITPVGGWIINIALYFILFIFLVGLTLDDAWSFIGKKFTVLYRKITDNIRKKSSKKEKRASNEELPDDEFIPPEPPQKGTKYRNKPHVDPNPYATNEYFDDKDPQSEKQDDFSAFSSYERAELPGKEPEGWMDGIDTEEVRRTKKLLEEKAAEEKAEKEEQLPPIKRKNTEESVLKTIFEESQPTETGLEGSPAVIETIDDPKEPSAFSKKVKKEESKKEDAVSATRTRVITEEPDGTVSGGSLYTFPTLDLLKSVPPTKVDMTEELNMKARKLVETLRSFRVGTKIINISKGPTITRYELQPDEGVRVRSIANLQDDIACNLAAEGVRIEAPIPGKAAVGVEVPNKIRETVYLRSLIEDRRFSAAPAKLTAAVGVDIGGDPVYADIAKMPHLLIAGTTGSGKSVCMNCLILSMLYKSSPDEVKMIMIDPKKVEFSIYQGLPHLIIPVVSNAKKAAGALSWAVSEMERRYELMETVGVRDIKNFNRITADDPEFAFMPQLVIIIDELADLMMTAPTEVEESICRIAQKGRACGMHLIIGTQRPSVDVITGLIKANVPSRIAFTVSSQVDSRTIIDIAGAEKLVGKGDMLFAPIGSMKPSRLQGAFVSDEEVEAVVTFIKSHSDVAQYDDSVISDIDKKAALCGTKGKKAAVEQEIEGFDEDTDPMLKAAIDLAVESGKISTSLIQRRLSLGYGRAAKLIDEMQKKGFVSPPEGQKPRTVLISAAEWAEMCMRSDDSNNGEE